MSEPKIVGYHNGQPIYEVAELPSPDAIQVPVSSDGREKDYLHRVNCLGCLYASLGPVAKEFGQFIANTYQKIVEIDEMYAAPQFNDQLAAERAELVKDLALASEGYTSLLALLRFVAKYINEPPPPNQL